jgi:hypothetical protein
VIRAEGGLEFVLECEHTEREGEGETEREGAVVCELTLIC